MTALAGVIGDRPEFEYETACRLALDSQQLYGTCPPLVEVAGNAAFGACAHDALLASSIGAVKSEQGRFLLAADIRLDNRTEMMRALGSDKPPNVPTDIDILASAWDKWGDACLDRLVGDFAFAAYDIERRTVFLARDASAQRPLFYGMRDGRLTFASMPSGVLNGGPVRANLAYLAKLMAGVESHGPATAFEAVHKVLPGEIVTIALPAVTRRTYWRPETQRHWPDDRPALVEAYRSHLDEAVRCRIAGKGEVAATHLSSGYDSSAVAATAARVKPRDQRLVAYTSAPSEGFAGLVPRGRIADESPIAAEVAAMHGLRHVVVRSAEPLLSGLRGYSRFHQEPIGNVFNLQWVRQIRHEAASAGASVLLNGALGNYTLNAGGLPVLHDLVRRGRWLAWWREAHDAVVRRNDVRWRGALVASFRPWMPGALLDAAERLFNGWPSSSAFCFLNPQWRQLRDPPANAPPVRRGDYAEERLAVIRSADWGPFRKGGLAEAGVQECDPTADRRLIEFSLRLPLQQMLHKGVYRPLARAALADRLPASVIDAPLRGYQAADWFARLDRAGAMAMLEEISASKSVRELIDLGALRRAIEDWPDTATHSFGHIAAFGRTVTNALFVGVFLAEVERYPAGLGV